MKMYMVQERGREVERNESNIITLNGQKVQQVRQFQVRKASWYPRSRCPAVDYISLDEG